MKIQKKNPQETKTTQRYHHNTEKLNKAKQTCF